jgi:hypothetical protein
MDFAELPFHALWCIRQQEGPRLLRPQPQEGSSGYSWEWNRKVKPAHLCPAHHSRKPVPTAAGWHAVVETCGGRPLSNRRYCAPKLESLARAKEERLVAVTIRQGESVV